jgi:hypothetical protein
MFTPASMPASMRLLITIAACTLLTTGVVAARRAPAPQIPNKFTNLQILPKDISQPNMVAIMKSFATSLGTRCEHCHVGQGNDLSGFDFASDTKPEKAMARKMMAMVTAIAHDHLANLGLPKTPSVTCNTCHRGALKPATAP